MDLPVPLGPTRATCRPGAMSMEKPSKTFFCRLQSTSSASYSKCTLRKWMEGSTPADVAPWTRSTTAGGWSIMLNRRRAAMIDTRKSV